MPDDQPDGEVAALKRRVDELTEQLYDVRAEQQRRSQDLVEMLRSMGLSAEEIEAAVSHRVNNGMTRRAALVGIVGTVAAGSYLAGTERARADSTGQIGTTSDPLQKVITDSVDIGAGGLTYGSHAIGAILEAESAGERVEHGEVTHDHAASGGDGWDTFDQLSTAVTFDTAFSSTPVVVTDANDTAIIATAFNRSTTGFDFISRNYQNTDLSSRDMSWVAIGGD